MLRFENCKCRKKLVDKLVDECAETVEDMKIAKITLAENESGNIRSSCAFYIVLFSMFFTINLALVTYCIYLQ